MDKFLKRKLNDRDEKSESKKTRVENCPYGEQCLRLNPQHFKELNHPHLTAFLEQQGSLTLPDGYPQRKELVQSQLQIIKENKNSESNITKSDVLSKIPVDVHTATIENVNCGIKLKTNTKTENCPHGDRCFRRNPHHFREYNHLSLEKFLDQGESFSLPDNYPQPKHVVQEQLQIMQSLRGIKSVQTATTESNDSSNASSSNPSTSFETKTYSKKGKSRSFDLNSQMSNCSSVKLDGKSMAEKMKENAPYNLFFTKIPDSPNTHNQANSISFTDLLCPSLGKLKCSLQINFMIDIAWLMEQYEARNVGMKPLTIIYGDDWPDMDKYIKLKLPNVTNYLFKMRDPFGTHHSKIGIYVYEDNSLRVVVSTANLYYEDWNYYSQGLWVSPRCPLLPQNSSNSDGDGPTGFKTSLLKYLKSYSLASLKEWIKCVEQADFSDVKVVFVPSIPGKSYSNTATSHYHRVGTLLSLHCLLPPKTTPETEGPLSWGVIAQASSIGSLGKTPAAWLRSVLLGSLASHKQCSFPSNSSTNLSVVYPTKDNVLNSYYGPLGGGCLPYSKSVHEKQLWFKEYLCQWKADHTARNRAMPHIKTYCRVSPCLTKLAWFLLTSANISKSAWGGNVTRDGSVYVRSYEVGVLFLPKYFDQERFTIKRNGNEDNGPIFPFIYDLPLSEYQTQDYPWCN